ncbi:hypothetical protein CHUAL_003309 [Chamberlinius hualienensis]
MMLDEIVKNTIEAISKGRTDVILTLIETYGKAAVTEKNGDSVSLKTLLDSPVTECGTLLHYATLHNQMDITRTLMLAGADTSIRNGQNKSCFDLAETVEMQGVYLHELMRVIASSSVSKVAQILGSGFDVNSQNLVITRDTPLHWAATYADFSTICYLLDKGANPNAINCYGATPLHDAIMRGEPDIVEELLRHGANPNIRPKSGKYLERFSPSMTDSDSFIIRDDESDLERISDSSSSWINAGGSHDSLTVACPTEIIRPLDLSDAHNHKATLIGDSDLNVNLLTTQTPNEMNYTEEFASIYKLFWPRPRQVHLLQGEGFPLSNELAVYLMDSCSLESRDQIPYKHLDIKDFGHLPKKTSEESIVLIHINSKCFGGAHEAFTINVTSTKIILSCSDVTALYYGVSFLVNYFQHFTESRIIPLIKVSDWPKWKFRGWMIDISLTKPALKFETLRREIYLASLFRYNHLLLHINLSSTATRNDQEYLTSQEFLNLEKYCDEKFVNLIPSFDLCTDSDRFDNGDIIFCIRNYLKKFSRFSYVYIGGNLARFLLYKDDFDLMNLFSTSCLIFETSMLDANCHWLHRVPLNSILITSSKHFGGYSSSCLVQRRLSNSGFAINAAVPCLIDESITGCSSLLLSSSLDVARLGNSVESVVFIMSGLLKPSKYHLMRTFLLPAMAFGGGMAWNPDFKTDDIVHLLSSLLNFYVFGNSGKFGDAIMELLHVETSLKNDNRIESLSILYELISNPDNVGLEYMNAERIQKTVRDLKLSVGHLLMVNIKETHCQVALEEIQLVADLMLFSLRLCRNLLSAGQNPNLKNGQSPSQLAVINVGISNLAPPIRTDLANVLLQLMRRFRNVNLLSHASRGLEQEGQPFYSIFQKLIVNNMPGDILDV